ncbi:cadherin-like domain-containing protein [Vibrio lentus]|nr:cadherin-like domain-containing protein [Vibrio lentus]
MLEQKTPVKLLQLQTYYKTLSMIITMQVYLTIENLHADHGSIAINKDGSFSFTPEKDYNGDVHFTYDVKDGHGGVTHTGATTNLAAVGDAATITGMISVERARGCSR